MKEKPQGAIMVPSEGECLSGDEGSGYKSPLLHVGPRTRRRTNLRLSTRRRCETNSSSSDGVAGAGAGGSEVLLWGGGSGWPLFSRRYMIMWLKYAYMYSA